MKCDRFASMLLILCMVLAGCAGPAAPEEGETAAERPAPEAPAENTTSTTAVTSISANLFHFFITKKLLFRIVSVCSTTQLSR